MPRIFKAGDYGKKGNYSADKLKSWVGKEFNITAGHVGDWVNNGYPVTAIPVAGTCKVTDVDNEGYLIGEFSYNSLGESIKDKYPNLSIGIGANGEPNHLAILGYAPPHIKDLDQSFSEFSQDLTSIEKTETIEFAEEDAQGKIDEFAAYLKGVDASKIKLQALFDVMWDKDSEQNSISIKDKYPNLSIGIGANGEPNHLAILGYAPPHIKDLDQSFSEFSQDLTSIEKTETIEFAEEDAQGKIDEFIAFFKTVDVSKVNYKALFDVLYEKDDEKYAVNKLKDLGYTVESIF